MSTLRQSAEAPPAQSDQPVKRRPTRISSLHVGLIVAAVLLILLIIFLVQNAHTVDVSFLGGHLQVSLAVAMLMASVAGALIVGAAGAARIGQLRRSARRNQEPPQQTENHFVHFASFLSIVSRVIVSRFI